MVIGYWSSSDNDAYKFFVCDMTQGIFIASSECEWIIPGTIIE
jgi:hypothetical protein